MQYLCCFHNYHSGAKSLSEALVVTGQEEEGKWWWGCDEDSNLHITDGHGRRVVVAIGNLSLTMISIILAKTLCLTCLVEPTRAMCI